MSGTPTTAEAVSIAAAALRAAPVFSYDLETTGFDPLVDRIKGLAVAVGQKKDERWYFPFMGAGAVSQVQTFREMAPALTDSSKLLVGSNIKFDYQFSSINSIDIQCKFADTMVGHWLIDENAKRHGLKEIVYDELGVEMMTYNEAMTYENDVFGSTEFAEYAKDDARYALKMWTDKIEPRLKKEKLLRVFHELEMEIVRSIAGMEMAGVRVDADYLREYQKKLAELCREAEVIAKKLAKREFDIASSSQVSSLLFDELGIRPTGDNVRGKTGYYSTDDSFLSKYPDVPIIDAILKWREHNKILSTYVMPYLRNIKADGRLHAKFKHTGTVTGRFSSEEPNLQNVPSGKNSVKRAFIAAEGMSFVCGDFNQIEFRMAGHFAMHYLGKSSIAEAYIKGSDLHKKTMVEMGFDKQYPDKNEARRKAKVVNFGFIYGRGANAFAEENGMPIAQAKEWRNQFHQSYWELKELRDVCGELLSENGEITTITNRRRRIPEWKGVTEKSLRARMEAEKWTEDEFKAKRFSLYWAGWVAWNSLVQGSTSDYVKVTMRNFNRRKKELALLDPRWAKTNLLIQVHDELLIECPTDLVPDVKVALKDVAENAMKLRIPVLMEVSSGQTWEAAKP